MDRQLGRGRGSTEETVHGQTCWGGVWLLPVKSFLLCNMFLIFHNKILGKHILWEKMEGTPYTLVLLPNPPSFYSSISL